MSREDPSQSSLPQSENRLDKLLSQLVDSTLAPKEHEELAERVSKNDDDLERFVGHVLLDTLLRAEIGPESIGELIDLMQGDPPAKSEHTPIYGIWLQETPRKVAAGVATLAAFVFLAFGIFRGGGAGQANAAAIVRAAIDTAGQNVERVYIVEVTKGDAVSPKFARTAWVATKGDRFWVEMNRGKQRWVWGRMADDSIWLTVGPHRAILLSSDEIGEPLQQIAETFSLRTHSLLQDVIAHCKLEYSQPDEMTHRIVATPKSRQRHRIQRAVLDVDIETKVVRRLTIKRQVADGHTSIQTFIHVETRSSDESLFRPEGHLHGEMQILDHSSKPERRAEILQEIFGSTASGWLRSSN